MTEQKRVFVAVNISEEARRAVAGYVDKLRLKFPDTRCRWVPPENLHITAWFIGNIDAAALEKWKEWVSLAADALASFKVELKSTGRFSQYRQHSHVLWLGANSEPADRFVQIVHYLHEDKRVKPHLTIGRLKNSSGAGELISEHLSSEFGPLLFQVNELVIYESKLGPDGSIYTPIFKAPLRIAEDGD
ncbi:MAG: RNA 2',3'-cyclic phosphodiesterase [Pyrinomonadaceae bacterium]